MATIFTRIIQGEIPCYKIAEDDRFFAFLDINPLSKGHTLVVPKQETDYIFNLEDDTIGPMMVFAKKVAKAIEKAVPCKRIAVAVIGLEVPHAHIHLVPITQEGDLDFKKEHVKLSTEEFLDIQKRITSAF
ncbi:MAG: HIT family protein [Bacteroidales bacterium]|jgi:histidine triad (HIT) family protein|nr:HIT family protein [Bacteroidales bacterium]MBQ5958449.1 HIT family protein [Bacteroidales bacterium]